jgi:hypothetical protein
MDTRAAIGANRGEEAESEVSELVQQRRSDRCEIRSGIRELLPGEHLPILIG